MNYIIKYIEAVETKQDLWMVFELGGSTLAKSIFDIKGEFHKGERIYGVTTSKGPEYECCDRSSILSYASYSMKSPAISRCSLGK